VSSWVTRGNHPVLQAQSDLNNGAISAPVEGFLSDLGASIDETPAFVAGIVIGALGLMFALKAAGFRFNFGVGAAAKVG